MFSHAVLSTALGSAHSPKILGEEADRARDRIPNSQVNSLTIGQTRGEDPVHQVFHGV